MDDPWADSPPTPRTGTPRVSLDGLSSGTQASPLKVGVDSSTKSKSETETETESEAEPAVVPSEVLAPPIQEDLTGGEDGGFDDDDFDDFDAPEAGPSMSFPAPSGGEGDDGFGDFGDFEEGDFGEEQGEMPSTSVEQTIEPEVQPERWAALNLRPFPTRSELVDQLSNILSPLVPPLTSLSDEPLRSVGGLSQVMVGESSRDVYAQLTTAPMLKPLDWTRSRVRREHLISMGVPVNLDEVDSHRLSALPPLRITTLQNPTQPRRATSLDVNEPLRDNGKGKGKSRDDSNGPRSAAPASEMGMNGEKDKKEGKYGLGQQPEMDMPKAEELCGLEEDSLSLLPLSTLQAMQSQIAAVSAQASATLAWSLQLKDAQIHDSATYNGMISELISNAAKAKSAQQTGSGGVFRRSSQKVPMKQNSHSGHSTPRTGSPAIR